MFIKKMMCLVLALMLLSGSMCCTIFAEESATGTITPAYTSTTSIWGEASGNANAGEQFEIMVYSGEKLIATAALTEYDNLKDGDVYVTWTIPTSLSDYNDPYWELSWEEGMPASNYPPTHADLWVNGEKVSTNEAQLNGPDDLNPVEWVDNPENDIPGVDGVTIAPSVCVVLENGDVIEYASLQQAINVTYSIPKKEIRVNEDIFEEITSLYGNIVSGNVNGVTINSTYDGWVYADEDFTLGENVAFDTEALFISEAEAIITGALSTENLYIADDATVSVYAPGSIIVNGSAHIRRNENLASGIYIYGDDDDSTVEYRSTYYSGIYSGTFHAEDASVEMGYVLLKNSNDTDYGTVKMELDNSALTVIGTDDGQNSFFIDGSANLSLTGNSSIKEVRDFNILADTRLSLTKDDSSLIYSENVAVAEGVPYIATDNGDGTWEFTKYLLGQGTSEDPYLINDLEDLLIFRDNVNSGTSYSGKILKLTDDIDLENEEWTPIGNSSNKFQGTFDGDNHTISNLLISGYNSYVGLFGFTTNGEIKNLTVENARISGRLMVGVVAGCPYTSKHTNITVSGHVEVNGMSYVGGVGGKDAYSNWTNITVDVDDESYVKAYSIEGGTAYRTYVGGVIGFMGEGGHEVKNVTSNIDVYGSTCDIGGIAGIAHYGNKFTSCSSSGNIYMEDVNEVEIGGITGVWHNGGSPVIFTDCSFTGKTYIGEEAVRLPISGPSYIQLGNDTATGECVILGKVTLNGVEKENLEIALAEAKEMEEPAVIDLLGNDATLSKAYVIENDITIKNGRLIFDNYDGEDPETYDPAGPYHALFTVSGNLTFDNVLLKGEYVSSVSGIFVIADQGVMTLSNDSFLEVIRPSATAVIYGDGSFAKLVSEDSKISIDGKDNAVRGILSTEIEADNSSISIKNITDNALRNVKGSIENSEIVIDKAEYGIKNTDNTSFTITNSAITITNTENSTENAGIYLSARENMADENTLINSKIFVEGTGEEEGVVLVTINFVTNGGNTLPQVEKVQGDTVNLSEFKPEKSRYTFVGWYSDASLTERIREITITEPITLYAKWKKTMAQGGGGGTVVYTVQFETNDGSNIKNISHPRNATIDLTEYIPKKEGFEFKGWYQDEAFEIPVTSLKITEDLTIYAKWEKIKTEEDHILLWIGKKKALVFGEEKTNDVAPVIRNDRTMLPARFVAEALGAKVTWSEDAPDKVVIEKDDIEIIIYIGKDYALVNGEEVLLDSPAFIENDRTYTPIRFISEALLATVIWDEENSLVTITKN